ncbi:MAG TPA: preprotein translocase subunit SecE, partial [Mycobacterium sp.]|nr:preprotein translocase subunit SecE [Mycobacterium sp.]
MSDEGDVADAAASNGGETEDSGGRTAVVTKPVARPQRPTGKRSRQRAADTEEGADGKESSTEVEVAKEDKAKKVAKTKTAKKTKKPKKSSDRSANPFVFVYTYLKQVVAEMR